MNCPNCRPMSKLRATKLAEGWCLFEQAGVSQDGRSLARFYSSLPGVPLDFSVPTGRGAGLEISYPPFIRWTPIPDWYCVIVKMEAAR